MASTYSGSDKQIQGIRSDRVSEELWMEVRDIVQETGIKTIPKEKKCKNPQQNFNKLNSATYQKAHTP